MMQRRFLRRLAHVTLMRQTSTKNGSTVDPKEVEFFGSEVNLHDWWREPNVLLSMNQTRVPLIRDALTKSSDGGNVMSRVSRPLQGVSILDVGCGGGILSEALARLGADVTGIDASDTLIAAAKQHASLDPGLQERLRYLNQTSEDLAATESDSFDGVVASEVVEHVSDVENFVGDCVRLTKPGGSIFVTTINQTLAAYMVAIIMAERLGPVQLGTHQYNKFVKPERLKQVFFKNNCSIQQVRGHMYNVFTNKWSWTGDTSIFYAIHAIKTGL